MVRKGLSREISKRKPGRQESVALETAFQAEEEPLRLARAWSVQGQSGEDAGHIQEVTETTIRIWEFIPGTGRSQ